MKGGREGFINYLASAMIGFIICFSTPEIDFRLFLLEKLQKKDFRRRHYNPFHSVPFHPFTPRPPLSAFPSFPPVSVRPREREK